VAGQELICEDSECAEFVLEKGRYKEKFQELESFLGNQAKLGLIKLSLIKNMSRSAKKGPYIDQNLLKKVLRQKESGDNSPIKTWARNSQISPDFVGHHIGIHNGRKFIEVLISETMVGHRLGEFSPTRTFRSHGKVTKKTLEPT